MNKYDLIVLGGGAGGLTVAAGAANMGAKVALVEKNDELGGDCLHYGCVPSKALIDAAKIVHSAEEASAAFDFDLSGKVNLDKVMDRVHAAIADIQEHDSKERFEALGIDVYFGKGHFLEKHVVGVNNKKIEGKRIVIATGSSPFIPPIEGIDQIDYLTNESIFYLKSLPKRLVVVGGGPIGLELSQAFARLGSEVTIIEGAPALMGREDEEIVPYLQNALEKDLTLKLNTKVTKVEQSGEEKILTVEQDDQSEAVTVDAVLIATGRRPNIESLNLNEIGVKSEKGNIVVNKQLQTTQKQIYAIGDTIGTFPFTHAAGMEGKVAVSNAVFGLWRKIKYDAVPWVTYTDPEIYHLGMTENEASEKYGEDISVYKVGVDEVDRFVADRETNGLLKIITNKKGYIIGAHAAGKDAGNWMQELVYAKRYKRKIGTISNVIHPYPTKGAIVQQAADQYWRNKLFEGVMPKLIKKYIRWFR
ncbi:dihydrolipoyl dehydrogenase family protein [Salinicoccus albus]|uniref:dihydrolipoyl dehydrogenase family protein n=1 Tax=Salinicoccus albus TaxID=418756 RepID=UPI00036E7CB9|nr:FAD-dependent oxidoreductase [Salinicoccus albus]